MYRRDDTNSTSVQDGNQGPEVMAITIIFTVLIILSTCTRLAAKFWIKLKFGPEDVFIVIALAFNLTCNATEFVMVNDGFGRHLQFLEDQRWTLKRYSQYTILFADISLWAVKISICCFLLGIIGKVHRRAKWALWSLISVTTLAATLQAIFWGLQATPLERLWNPDVPGTVASTQTLVVTIITFTAINSVTDLFYALAPVYFFRELNTSPRKKMILIALTGSGLLVFATSVIRIAYVKEFFNPDFTWALPRLYVCTVVERNFAEVIADLPIVFSFARNMRKKTVTYLSNSSPGGTKAPSASGPYGILSRPVPLAHPGATAISASHNFSDFSIYRHSTGLTNRDLAYAEDEYSLREHETVPRSHGMITIQTDIHLQSQDLERSSAESRQHMVQIPGWPADTRRSRE